MADPVAAVRLAKLEAEAAEAANRAQYRREKIQAAALARATNLSDWQKTVEILPEDAHKQALDILSQAVAGNTSYVLLPNDRRAGTQYVALPITVPQASRIGDDFAENPKHVPGRIQGFAAKMLNPTSRTGGEN